MYNGLHQKPAGFDANFTLKIWLRDLDSNQDNILQRDVSYH
jgi:hypothetical protein